MLTPRIGSSPQVKSEFLVTDDRRIAEERHIGVLEVLKVTPSPSAAIRIGGVWKTIAQLCHEIVVCR